MPALTEAAMPRRHKLLAEPEIIKNIATNVELGLHQADAAIHSGISERSYWNYIHTANEAQGILEDAADAGDKRPKLTREQEACLQLLRDVKKATAGFKRARLGIIGAASVNSWQAAAWSLERKFPDEFGQRSNISMSNQEPVQAIKLRLVAGYDKDGSEITPFDGELAHGEVHHSKGGNGESAGGNGKAGKGNGESV